jgi:hypothetical protein
MKRVVLRDTTGSTWTTVWSDEMDPETEAQIVGLFEELGELTHFSMDVEGFKRYFNPAHIVVAWIEEKP